LTKGEVQAYCVDKIAKYKIPSYVLFVDSYPTTASGKIQKYKLGAGHYHPGTGRFNEN